MKLFTNAICSNYLLSAFIILLVSCTVPEQNMEKDQEAIKATLVKMWDAIEKEDIDTYASFIHPDFTQFGEFDEKLKIGKDLEVKGTLDWVLNSENIHTEMIDPLVTIKGDVGWITYYWSDSGVSGGKAFTSKGKSTRIFVKVSDKWLCIHGHYTILPN